MLHGQYPAGLPPSEGSSPGSMISQPNMSDNEKYLEELVSERQKLAPFVQVLPYCSRLLSQEISRVTALLGCATLLQPDVAFESPQARPTQAAQPGHAPAQAQVQAQPSLSQQQMQLVHQLQQQQLQPQAALPQGLQAQAQPSPLPPAELQQQALAQQPSFPPRGLLSRSPSHQPLPGLHSPYDTSPWAPLPSDIVGSPSLFLPAPSPSTPNPARSPVRWTAALPQRTTPAGLPGAAAPIVKRSRRIEVPVDQFPTFNFVGRILGPRGNSLKRVESQTGCRVLIRGRGSIKDPAREDKLRDKPGYEHLREPLHVIVEAELPADVVDSHINQACEILEELLKPVDESHDIVKKAQLRELAILNGTLREESPSPSSRYQPPHHQHHQHQHHPGRGGAGGGGSSSFMGSPSPSASVSSSVGDAGMKRPKTRR